VASRTKVAAYDLLVQPGLAPLELDRLAAGWRSATPPPSNTSACGI